MVLSISNSRVQDAGPTAKRLNDPISGCKIEPDVNIFFTGRLSYIVFVSDVSTGVLGLSALQSSSETAAILCPLQANVCSRYSHIRPTIVPGPPASKRHTEHKASANQLLCSIPAAFRSHIKSPIQAILPSAKNTRSHFACSAKATLTVSRVRCLRTSGVGKNKSARDCPPHHIIYCHADAEAAANAQIVLRINGRSRVTSLSRSSRIVLGRPANRARITPTSQVQRGKSSRRETTRIQPAPEEL